MGAGTGAEVFVADWVDLRRLPVVMDEVGDQAGQIVDHATQWVCQRAGFEPSPVCLMRPLAEAMELVASAFEQVGQEFTEAWEDVREAVVKASADLESSDGSATAAAAALLAKLPVPHADRPAA